MGLGAGHGGEIALALRRSGRLPMRAESGAAHIGHVEVGGQDLLDRGLAGRALGGLHDLDDLIGHNLDQLGRTVGRHRGRHRKRDGRHRGGAEDKTTSGEQLHRSLHVKSDEERS